MMKVLKDQPPDANAGLHEVAAILFLVSIAFLLLSIGFLVGFAVTRL